MRRTQRRPSDPAAPGMEPESRYTLIGTIVLSLIGLVVFSFVWLTGAGSGAEFRLYTVYFERQSLEGLQVGGDVNMRGIVVGQVEDYAIERDNINRVKVTIRVSGETPVSTNSVAVVHRNLITGIADVNLETPGRPGPQLKQIPDGEMYPVIAEGQGRMEAITNSANQLIVKADEALKNINLLLSPDNQRVLRDILTAVAGVTGKLDQRLDSLDLTAVAFRQAAESISQSLNDVSGGFQPLTKEAHRAMRDLRVALREISKAAQVMQGSTATLTRQAANATDIGVTEIRATAHELRQGVDMLARTLDRLQDPRAALLGPGEQQLGPGETQ